MTCFPVASLGVALDAPSQEVEALVDVADPRLRLRQAQAHRREYRCHLVPQRFGVVAGASDHDHEIVRIADEAVGGQPLATALLRGAMRRPDRSSTRRRNDHRARTGRCWPAAVIGSRLGGAGDRVPLDAILGEDAGRGTPSPAPGRVCPRSVSHPAHQGRVVDLVEARRDIALEYPLVGAGGEAGGSRRSHPGLGVSGGSRNDTAGSPPRRSARAPA